MLAFEPPLSSYTEARLVRNTTEPQALGKTPCVGVRVASFGDTFPCPLPENQAFQSMNTVILVPHTQQTPKPQ